MTPLRITLPRDILERLADKSKQLALPENEIIEQALRIYFDEIDKALYRNTYQQATKDQDILMIAEEGMVDYLTQLTSRTTKNANI
ncbi:MAG: CopG family transcriptional regulator [Cyclobacteriaceae bacterium]